MRVELGRFGGMWMVLAGAAVVTACGSADAGGADEAPTNGPGGAGGGGGAGAADAADAEGGSGGEPFDDPDACSAADTTCPESRPAFGAACEPGLTCEYPSEWSYTCDAAGLWQGEQDCSELIGGVCNLTPETESCDGPTLSGVSGVVEIGPAESGPFRVFESGEEAPTEVGPQGSGMLYYRVNLADSDALPTCVELTTTLAIDGAPPEEIVRHVRLRCGQSAQMYAILPFAESCGTGLVEAELTVELTGVGATTVDVMVDAAALCGGFG